MSMCIKKLGVLGLLDFNVLSLLGRYGEKCDFVVLPSERNI